MTLIRHVAGIPTATEQRCVRCCEVISTKPGPVYPAWPGETIDCGFGPIYDCAPYDPHAEGGNADMVEPLELLELRGHAR